MLISVIIPVYKVEKYIYRCIKSVLKQSLDNFELILVDDGSNDKCGDICDSFALLDERILVIHKLNGGLSDARNAGIDWAFINSDSDWLTFIDSDDWVDPKYLEYLYTVTMMTNCKVSVCDYQKTNGNVFLESKASFNYKTIDVEDFYSQGGLSFIVAWGKLYQKELLKDIRYPVNKLHEDEFVTYRVLFSFNHIALVQQNLYFYFFNQDSITAKWSPKRLDSLEALRNQIVFFQDNGYERAYNQALYNAAINISNNCLQVQDSTTIYDKEEYFRLLSREMRDILSFKNAKKVLPFSEFKHFYEIAYPGFMKQYWRFQSIKSKIKGRNSEKN